jgi:putative membrane protein
MRNWILRWVASTVALLAIIGAYNVVTPSHRGIYVDSATAVVIAVVLLGLVNSIIKPIILFFAMPINCLTFGLFGFVLNVLLFLMVGNLGFGFHVRSPIDALIGSVAMGILSGVLNSVLADSGDHRRDRKRDRDDN